MSFESSRVFPVRGLEKLLGTFRLFHGLDEGMLAPLVPVFELHKVDEGEDIIEFDAIETQVFFIVRGTVQVNVPLANSRESETVCELKAGDTVGEFLLARKGRRSAACLALSDLELLVADATRLSEVFEQHPDLGMRVYRNLSGVLSDRLQDNNMLIRRVLGK